MAYGRKVYNYTLKFDADVSNVRRQMQQTLDELSKIASKSTNLSFDNELREAALAAQLLGKNLQLAYNVDTNKLDLTKFNNQLRLSGMTLLQYANIFKQLGPDGERAFLNVALAISKAETPALKLNSVLDNLWITMKNTMRWQLTSSMLHGFIGSVLTAWRYTLDLNESLTAIRVVTGMSAEEMSRFAQEANKAAQALNTTTVDYTDASLIYYQQGLDAEKVKERTRITIDAANAAGTSAELMSEYLTAVWNSYQVATDQLESYVDKMAAVGASTATSLQEISTAMVNVASTANTVGVSMDQLTAIISTVASTTRQSATTIGTAYKTIFARMGDLTLGETLEDGLDLGTVSKQLSDIGVLILDVNGDLRDMGSVVEEIGDKWQTWTTAQQTAVALAIAGKRQYTLLIALFDNWDAYQNALSISENSEGTLAKLAETFAEGWEAARRRVKAAWEGVYDSIINPEAMIKFDNAVVSVLHRVENVADAMGGFIGIANTVGNAIFTLYGDQIVGGLRNLEDMYLQLSHILEKRNNKLREENIEALRSLDTDSKQILLIIEKTELQLRFELERSKLPNIVQQLIEYELGVLDTMLEIYRTTLLQNEALEERANLYLAKKLAAGRNIDFNPMSNMTDAWILTDMASASENNSTYAELLETIARTIKSQADAMGETLTLNLARSKATAILANLEAKIVEEIKELSIAYGAIDSAIDKIEKIRLIAEDEPKKIDEAKSRILAIVDVLKNIPGVMDRIFVKDKDINTSIESLEVGIHNFEKNDLDIFVNKMHEALSNIDNVPNDIPPYYEKLREVLDELMFDYENLGRSLISTAEQSVVLEEQSQRILESIKQLITGINSWANSVVSFGLAFTSLGMMFSSITNLGKTWDEFVKGDITSVDALTRTMTSLGMIVPVIMRGYKGLAAAAALSTVVTGLNTIATDANTLAKITNSTATFLLSKAMQMLLLSTLPVTAVVIALTAALAILVAGIALVVHVIDNFIHAEEKARESIAEVRLETEKQRQVFEDLNNELLTTKNRIKELEAKDTLTFVELEELAKLYEAEASLERQAAIEERLYKALLGRELKELIENGDKSTKTVVENPPSYDLNRMVTIGGLSALLIMNLESELDEDDPLYKLLMEDGTIDVVINSTFGENLDITREEGFVDVDTWWNNLSEAQQQMEFFLLYRERWIESNQETIDAWIDDNKEGFLVLEDNYTTYLELYKYGLIKEEELNELRERLALGRKNQYYGDYEGYEKAYVLPELNRKDFLDEYNELIGNILETGNIGDKLSEELQDALRNAGIPLEDFKNGLLRNLLDLKEKLSSFMSSAEINDFLKFLTPEDLNLLFTINFKDLDSFDKFYAKFLELKAGALVKIDLEVAKEEARNALASIAEGEFLDDEIIASLQEKFAGLYDFSNLGNLSLYDQAKLIGEALIIAANPVDIYNEKLEESKTKLDDINDKIKTQKAVLESLISVRLYSPVSENIDKEILKVKQEIKDLEKEKIDVEVDITDAEIELEKLAELSDIAIELEVDDAAIDAVVGQMGAIANAANLIGEGFKVEAENVQELIRTMPQLLEDATIDMETGMVQLQLGIVEKVAETAQLEVALTAEALRLKLTNRYNEILGEIDLLNSVKENAANAKREEVTNDEVWNNIEKENKIKVVQAIIKARMQQAVLIVSQSAQESSNQVQDLNKVTEASKEQGLLTQENWRKTAENAAKYFRQFAISAVLSQNAVAQNKMPTPYVNIASLGSVGFSTNASDLSWNYDTSAGLKYATTTKFLDSDFHLWEAGTPEATDLANTISKELAELGFTLSADVIQQGTESVIDAFISSNYDNWQDFTQDIDTALNDRFYKLRIVGEDLSRLLAGIGNAEALKTSGIEEDKSKSKDTGAKEKVAKGSELKEKQEEEIERYHEINKLLEYQSRLLQEVSTQIERTYGAAKLKEFNKELKRLNDLIDSETKKMEEAKGWAEYDLAQIKKLGMNPQLSDDGRLLNYTELLKEATDEYNKFVEEWNSHQNEKLVADENGEYPLSWLEIHEEEKKLLEELYSDRLEALKKFEESVKTYWDEFDKREQYKRDLEDNKLKKIAYVLEFQIDYKNAKKDVRNLSKAIEEAIGDALTHGMKAAMLDYQNMLDEMNMQGHYQSNFDELLAKIEESRTNQYIDQEELANQLANLRDNVIESAEALIEWAESVEDIVPDAIDAARDRFDQFTDQLEHNTSIIDTIKEIMVLLGLTIKTAQGYRDTRDMYNKRMDATLAQAKLNRQWYDNALKELQIAQTELDSATEGTLQYDILKANRDALLQQFNDAQQAMLDSAKETMETAREMYLDGVKRTAYELELTLTKGDGFDLLQDKYDHYIDTEERYLDTVNKIYETTKLNNKIQEQLDKTTNSAHAKRLKELLEEFREREKNNKLSEYDILIMNAKLAMLTKLMELEDAANNKSVARVVRNSRGNYDYQFTANPDELAAINQEYLDAALEYYNIAKNQVKEVSGEIIDTWQEMTDKIKEIYEDETLTVDEREARIAEIREYYTQKVKDLEAEKQKAIKDMTEAGNIAIDEFREAHKNTLDEMGGDVDNFRDIFSDDLASILDNQNEFNNTFATDLDKLSEPILNFEELFDNTINDMEDHVKEYGDKVSDVNDQVGVSYDDLKDILDQVSDSTEQITWRGQEAVSNMWELISAVQQLSIEYANMADLVLQAALALRDLAQATLEAQFDRLGGAQDMTYDSDIFNDRDLYDALGGANIDYSALMSLALASGLLQYGSGTYNKLMDFRDIYYGDRGGTDKGWLTNEELDKIFKDYSQGKLTGDSLDWFNQASGNYTGPYENNLGDFLYWLEKLKIQGFATGGYTGDFDNGKLAILHEKELVLNEDDTKNILDTVNILRDVDSSIWTTISKALDASISMFKNALSSILTPYVKVERDKDTLEQKVEIKAEFPNVTDSGEIIEAFDNIINVAAQYASQRD